MHAVQVYWPPTEGACMNAPLTDFWAKLSFDDKRRLIEWHPLISHCADVAACFDVLISETILGRRLAATLQEQQLTTTTRARLGFLAALHDAGKVNLGFQRKAHTHQKVGGKRAGHLSPIIDVIDSTSSLKVEIVKALRFAEVLEWFDDEEQVIEMIVTTWGHHGRPVRIGTDFDDNLWAAGVIDGLSLSPIDGLGQLADAAASWFPEAFDADAPSIAAMPAFQHLYIGILTLADWMGSDSRFFIFDDGEPRERFEWAREVAFELCSSNGLLPARARLALGVEPPGFERVNPAFRPRPLQRECVDAEVRQGGELFVLESDTGSGKTEAALARYLKLFHAGEVDGLYFALPTRTAATQLHERLVEILTHAFPDEEVRPPVSLAVPGYIRVDEHEGVALPHFRVLWQDDPNDEKRWRGWSAEQPKRFLSGAIVVGTIDQVLLSTLRLNHAHMRYAALSRSLLVVDEVHASDVYMTCLLEEVLKHHLALGGHALLMSATLGQSTLASFTRDPMPALEEALARPYPMITRVDAGREEGAQYLAVEASDYNKRVEIELYDLPEERDEVFDHALLTRVIDDALQGARVLVIRNTVGDCVATLRALEDALSALPKKRQSLLLRCNEVAVPHHSRFASGDRRLLDKAIERAMGKDSTRSGVIAVATQTVQQSLDLDADILYSDLCPMDVLLQRVGRLHRHPKRTRPVGYEAPRLVVLTPPTRALDRVVDARSGRGCASHGIGTVYEDLRVLDATWTQLESRASIAIPAQNRELVECSLHPDVLAEIVANGGAKWELHDRQVEGEWLADAVVADNVILRRDVPYPADESMFPNEASDVAVKVQTRLGADDRVAVFDAPQMGPLGQQIRQIKIPEHLCKGAPADAVPEDVVLSPGEVTFAFGGESFCYTRFGLEKVEGNRDA